MDIEIEHAEVSQESVATALQNMLSYRQPSIAYPNITTAESVADILFGTKKIRHGCAPNKEEKEVMTSRVEQFMQTGRPIRMQMLYGVLKGYGLIPDRWTADTVDLLAIRRFSHLNRNVQEWYQPGLQVEIIVEDMTENIIAGDYLDVPSLIGPYAQSLDRLLNVVAKDSGIRFIRESDILKVKQISPNTLVQHATEYASLMEAYWTASENAPVDNWESLAEYHALLAAGWQGIIPPNMRSHYLCRAQTERPDSSDTDRRWSICKYFGNSLARYQMGIFTADDPSEPDPIRASLAPHANGASRSLRKGRVEYKLTDSKTSNHCVPPWAGFGFLRSADDGLKLTPIGLRDFRRIDQTGQYIQNCITIASDNGSMDLRADILI